MCRCLLWSLIPLCLKVMNFLRMPRTGLSFFCAVAALLLSYFPTKSFFNAFNLSTIALVALFGGISKSYHNRARAILAGCKGGSVGSYSDSPGIEVWIWLVNLSWKHTIGKIIEITFVSFCYSQSLADHQTPCGRIHWTARRDAIRLCRFEPILLYILPPGRWRKK